MNNIDQFKELPLSTASIEILNLLYDVELSSLEKIFADSLSPEDSFSFLTSGILGTNGSRFLPFTRRHLRCLHLQKIIGDVNSSKQLHALFDRPKTDADSLWNDKSIKYGTPNTVRFISASIFISLSTLMFSAIHGEFAVYLVAYLGESLAIFFEVLLATLITPLLLFNVYYLIQKFTFGKKIPIFSLINVFVSAWLFQRDFISEAASNTYFNKTTTIQDIRDEYYKVVDKDSSSSTESYLEHYMEENEPSLWRSISTLFSEWLLPSSLIDKLRGLAYMSIGREAPKKLNNDPLPLVEKILGREGISNSKAYSFIDTKEKCILFDSFMGTDFGLEFRAYLEKEKLRHELFKRDVEPNANELLHDVL